MLNVEIEDLGRIYDCLNQEEFNYLLGTISIKDSCLDSISTEIFPEDKNYLLKGMIEASGLDNFLPFEEITAGLKGKYNIKKACKSQIFLEKENKEYLLEIELGNFFLTTKTLKGSKEQLKAVLEDYQEILTKSVEAYYLKKGQQSPDLIYFLGREITPFLKAEDALKKNEQGGLLDLMRDNNLKGLERKIEVPSPNVEYDDVVGLENLKSECQRIYRDLINPERSAFFGRDSSRQRNILINGEKGGGKTMTVSALATQLKRELGEEKVKFYLVEYAQITSIYRGGEAQATSKIFDLVKKNEEEDITTVLFFDEAHQIGTRQREFNEALDVMLTKLDGLRKYKKTITLASTYMPLEVLDPAFVDRFKRVEAPPLNLDQKVEIFRKAVEKKRAIAKKAGNPNIFDEIDYEKLKPQLEKLSGRAIGSENGIVEAVVEWKDDHTQDINEFTPITTEDILYLLESLKPEEKTTKIGFR